MLIWSYLKELILCHVGWIYLFCLVLMTWQRVTVFDAISISIMLEVLHCFPEPVRHPIDGAFVMILSSIIIYLFVNLLVCCVFWLTFLSIYHHHLLACLSVCVPVCLSVCLSAFLSAGQCNLAIYLHIYLRCFAILVAISYRGTCHQMHSFEKIQNLSPKYTELRLRQHFAPCWTSNPGWNFCSSKCCTWTIL